MIFRSCIWKGTLDIMAWGHTLPFSSLGKYWTQDRLGTFARTIVILRKDDKFGSPRKKWGRSRRTSAWFLQQRERNATATWQNEEFHEALTSIDAEPVPTGAERAEPVKQRIRGLRPSFDITRFNWLKPRPKYWGHSTKWSSWGTFRLMCWIFRLMIHFYF